jgi:hypothetical protein
MDDARKTPLHWAAERDDREAAEELLNAGADLEARTSWGATHLEWAATMGSVKVADLLLSRGAAGMDLAIAANLGKIDVVRRLLDAGPLSPAAGKPAPAEPDDHWVADSARMKGDVISHAFYCACRNGHTEVAALLLERGTDVNAKGIFGGTGPHWAAINGHRGTVALLLSHGADGKFGTRSSTRRRRAGPPKAETARLKQCSIPDRSPGAASRVRLRLVETALSSPRMDTPCARGFEPEPGIPLRCSRCLFPNMCSYLNERTDISTVKTLRS